jgi:signal transduction histidine kinase
MLRAPRSTSLQLALGYAGLFVASALLFAGVLWWRTAGYLERGSDAVIRADTQAIKDTLQYEGLPAAVAVIDESVIEPANGRAAYLLVDGASVRIAGNLAAWPIGVGTKPGWYQVPMWRDGQSRMTQFEEVALPGGWRLLVGRDIEDLAEVRALVVRGLAWGTAGALLLAIGGGVLVRRAVLRRVDAINRAAGAIVRGDLSRRLPTRNTIDEFDQLAQTINGLLRQIEQLVEGVRNTANAVAHDLRTPLAELRTELEELIRVPPPSRVDMLNSIHKAVADIDRVIGIFNALLRLVEIDSGVRRSGFRRVELARIATEVGELYGPLAEEKDLAFVIDAWPGLFVDGDPYLLAQAVGNLVDNAVKYAPRGGMVKLCVAPLSQGVIEIAVADNGPGIADSDKPRVTERFYRCRGAGHAAGLGLGLSVVDSVARLHDGTLTLNDNNPGLIASLALPATSAAAVAPAGGSADFANAASGAAHEAGATTPSPHRTKWRPTTVS